MKAAIITGILSLLLLNQSFAAKPEFRGAWVHNWREGLLTPTQADETVAWAKSCNLNALVVQVRRLGDAYYDSAVEPRATNIQAGADFDPLGYVSKRAQENNMEVHAWFNLFRVGAATPPASPMHVINQHPEWLNKTVSGKTSSDEGMFLDPGAPGVREYLVSVITDLMKKYDVDGIMLDYVRYPGKDWGYNDLSVAAFNEKYGLTGKPDTNDPRWCNWRREQVTETVRAIYQAAHKIKPGIKVSAATIAWGSCPSDFSETSAYSSVYQDWRSWMQEGILDANMPMNYKNPSDAKASKWFADWVRGLDKWSYGRHVYNGLMFFDSAQGAVSQVKVSRNNGMEGIICFAFSQLDPKDKSALASALRKGVFTEAAPVPKMVWVR